jgi:NCS1 family nucleobase:cation symporter-1
MVTDYFFIRRTRLDVVSLYHRGGPYEYKHGVNPIAILALAAGIFIALIGLFVPALRFLYDYAWFVGFGTSSLVYLALMRKAAPVPDAPRVALAASEPS